MTTFEQIADARQAWEREQRKTATRLSLSPEHFQEWRIYCQHSLKFDLTRQSPPYKVSRGMRWVSSEAVTGDDLVFS